MAENYKVRKPCTLTPPPPAAPSKIDIPVDKVGTPPSPITKIVARSGSSTSYEREASPRYADIYFTSSQYTTLVNNVNSATVHISYDAPAIAGDDVISNVNITVTYP